MKKQNKEVSKEVEAVEAVISQEQLLIDKIIATEKTVAEFIRLYCGGTLSQKAFTESKTRFLASTEYKALSKAQAATCRKAFQRVAEANELNNTRDGKPSPKRGAKTKTEGSEGSKDSEERILETSSPFTELDDIQACQALQDITRAWFDKHGGSKMKVVRMFIASVERGILG